MIEQLRRHPTQEREIKAAIRPITQDELMAITSLASRSTEAQAGVTEYVGTNVSGVRIGNLNVLFVSHENEKDASVPDPMRALIADPRVKAVNMEYFLPELDKKTKDFPIIGGKLYKIWSKDHPVYYSKHTKKGKFAGNLAEVCRENGKVIAVSDPANGPAFESTLVAEGIVYGIPLSAAFSKIGISSPYDLLLGLSGFVGYRIAERFPTKGGIRKYEKIMPDVEDARRIQVAAGLLSLADEYQSRSDDVAEAPQIIVPYPAFHTDRIRHYLMPETTTDHVTRGVKQVLYRAATPYLDTTVRQYRWDDSFAKLDGDDSQTGWRRFSNRHIPRIK